MAVCIKLKCGNAWYSNEDIESVRAKVDRGEPVKVWWFTGWGQRFSESVWISSDELAYIMTEQDDG